MVTSLEGIEEKDTGKFVECPGVRGKLLAIEDCVDNCEYFKGRKTEEVKQGEKVVQVVDRIACAYPAWRSVKTACTFEVE